MYFEDIFFYGRLRLLNAIVGDALISEASVLTGCVQFQIFSTSSSDKISVKYFQGEKEYEYV